jgi:hypothetical protein
VLPCGRKKRKREIWKGENMKRLILVLAVLIGTPAFALTIDVNDIGGGDVAIEYSDANAANLPRAFGLVVTVDKGAFVSAIGGFITGESTSGTPGFGIFPGSIIIDVNDPNNTVYGNPIADACDPGSGNGTTTVVLELGSLYDGDGNSPNTSGTLAVLTIDCNGASDVNVVVTEEDTYRGGIILEDGTKDPNLTDNVIISADEPKCFPDTTPYAAQYADWVAMGEPNCWCSEASIPGDTSGNADDGSDYQCDGDSRDNGQIIDWRVYSNDLTDLIGSWKAKIGEGHLNPCADFTHDGQIIGWRVYSNDLTRLITNWKKTSVGGADPLPGDCPRPDATK